MRFLGFAIRDMSRRLRAKPPVAVRDEWHPVAGLEKDFRALRGAHEAKARQTVLWRFYCKILHASKSRLNFFSPRKAQDKEIKHDEMRR